MKVIPTEIPDVLIIEPQVYGDDRGFFLESFNQKDFREKTGVNTTFVQDNHSMSLKNVLRGLHSVFDVAVDARQSSPTFGQWVSCVLSAENKRIFWVPEGFAHGFLVLSERAEFLYKTTNYYYPQYEKTILWNDADLGIDWPLEIPPILSPKDQAGQPFKSVEVFP